MRILLSQLQEVSEFLSYYSGDGDDLVFDVGDKKIHLVRINEDHLWEVIGLDIIIALDDD